ncbi:MAG: aminotransferase class I/II-fold pyridoxal phosphate-dependent enzyme, partial [Bdellovibrionales bacterium]|nr:aminotransferase class I/II-fold pyridoxal phosphate-dependent enzyme [Bdellovibrionales bacterium]
MSGAEKGGRKPGFGTRAIHEGQPPEKTTGAVMTPIFQTSTYAQSSPGVHQGFVYARGNNPTRDAYQTCVASLENATHALAFSSGVAATAAILQTLSAGDHVLCCDDVYGGTFRLFDKVFKNLGLSFDYVDFTDLKKAEAAFKPNTKLLWLETPTNPMLKIFDIAAITKLARAKGV